MADFFDELFLPQKKSPSPASQKARTTSSTPSTTVRNNTSKPKTASSYNKDSGRADSHHPACDVEAPHRHEKAYVENSAGGETTEGCEEHYYDRIVTLDAPTEEESGVNEKLAEYFVMGEILMNPKFKKNRRW